MIAVRVAAALGKRLRAVDRWPWAEVLYVFLHLQQQDRRGTMSRDAESFQQARRVAVGVNAPDQLEEERQALFRRWRGQPAAPQAPDEAALARLVAADQAGTWTTPTPPEAPHAESD